jgi:hypothetical protein
MSGNWNVTKDEKIQKPLQQWLFEDVNHTESK